MAGSPDSPSPMQYKPVVIMTGSRVTYCGFAGELKPRSTFPTITGTRFFMGLPDVESPPPPVFVGDEAIEMRSSFRLGYPCVGWDVDSVEWPKLEKIWTHIFNKILEIPSKNHPTLIILDPRSNPVYLTRAAEILFGTLRVPAAGFADYGYLCAVAENRPTTCVVFIGTSETVVIPVIGSQTIVSAVESMGIAENAIFSWLRRLFIQRGVNLEDNFKWARQMEEILTTISFVPRKFGEAIQNGMPTSRSFRFPNCGEVKLTTELYEPAELLFHPDKTGVEDPPLPQVIANSIKKCDAGKQPLLLANIILSGTLGSLPGLADRLRTELESLFPSTPTIYVKCMPDNKYGPWIGGSILAKKAGAIKLFLQQNFYLKQGSASIHFIQDQILTE